MEDKQSNECEGNLLLELGEINKLIINEQKVEMNLSATIECSAFLTIRCY